MVQECYIFVKIRKSTEKVLVRRAQSLENTRALVKCRLLAGLHGTPLTWHAKQDGGGDNGKEPSFRDGVASPLSISTCGLFSERKKVKHFLTFLHYGKLLHNATAQPSMMPRFSTRKKSFNSKQNTEKSKQIKNGRVVILIEGSMGWSLGQWG